MMPIQYYLGVSTKNIDELKSVIVKSLNIPKDKVSSFNHFINFEENADSSTWTNYNVFLRNDDSGAAKNI